jgi:hypothetical protein
MKPKGKSGPTHARIAILTVVNIALFPSWYALREAHEAGDDYPVIMVLLAALTVSIWWQLLSLLLRYRMGKEVEGKQD